MRAVTEARLVTARWIHHHCPHDEATGCHFTFALPELELRLTGDEGPPLTVGYGDHAAQQEFFEAVQAEHERRDHPELRAPLTAEQEALVERLATGLGIPMPRRSTPRVAA
jgi:hypothetical protein